MNLQQLRIVWETVRHDFNLTLVAAALHTSQPGVSRHIRELETELGVELFERAGKRLIRLTTPGRHILPLIERIVKDCANIHVALKDLEQEAVGHISLAATHTQARYVLPEVVRDFRSAQPNVTLSLHQGAPHQVADMLIAGVADIGLATEALHDYEELVALPCYTWTHVAIVPDDHPLTDGQSPTLEQLAKYPLITYEHGYTGRARIDKAFTAQGLQPNIMLSAMDADVIKTYAQLGLGVGIIASMAFDAERDVGLRALDIGALLGINVTRLALRRGVFLRDYVYTFIETFAPTLKREAIRQAIHQ